MYVYQRGTLSERRIGADHAKYLLSHERTGIAGVGFAMQALEEVKSIAAMTKRGAKRLIDDPPFAARSLKWKLT